MDLIDVQDLADRFRVADGSNQAGAAVILQMKSMITPDGLAANLVGATFFPDFLYVWQHARPSALPAPVEIPNAVLHIRLNPRNLRAWIDGDVVNRIENDGDVSLNRIQERGVAWQEIASSARKYLLEGAEKAIGLLTRGGAADWDVSFRVEGATKILKALYEFILKGWIRAKITLRVDGDWTQEGKFLGIFPVSRDMSYSRSFDIEADVPIRRFKTDIGW